MKLWQFFKVWQSSNLLVGVSPFHINNYSGSSFTKHFNFRPLLLILIYGFNAFPTQITSDKLFTTHYKHHTRLTYININWRFWVCVIELQ